MDTTRPSAPRRPRPGTVTPAALLLTAAAAAAAAAGGGDGSGIPGVAGWKLSTAAALGGLSAAASAGGGSGWHLPWLWRGGGTTGRSGAAAGGGGAPTGGAAADGVGVLGPAAAVAAAAAAVTGAAAAAVEAAARPAKDPSWLVGAAAAAATPSLNYSQIMYARGMDRRRGRHGKARAKEGLTRTVTRLLPPSQCIP